MKTKNKIIAWTSLVFCFGLILATIFSTTYIPNAYAASNQGDESTAIKKLYYLTLKDCISDTSYFNNDGGTIFTPLMGAEDLKSGIWFSGSMMTFTGDEQWDNDGSNHVTKYGGAYIENAVVGEYDDGKIYCGESSNGLIKKATSELGVSYMDLACDYSDSGRSSGIFYSDTSESYCVDNINAGNDMYYNSRRTDYLEKVIKAKTFNNNVPGGSLDNLTNFEAYHVYYDTFLIACATGSPHYGDTGLAYQIKLYNPSTKKFEQAGFSQKNSAGTKVYTFGGEQKTCQQIADSLNGGEYYKAYEDYILGLQLEDKKANAASCIGAYNSNYDTLKSKKDGATRLVSILNTAASSAQGILDGTQIFSSDLKYPSIDTNANAIDPNGESPAVSSIKTAANDFLRKVNAYRVLDDSAKASGKEDFQNEIDTFKKNITTFQQTIADEIEEIYNELPVKNSTGVPTRISTSAYLDSGGTFIGQIDGVYKTNDKNELVCLVDQTFTSLNNKLKDSIGVEMSLEEYKPVSDKAGDITEGGESTVGDPCYNAGVDGMSWILCPAIENGKKTVDGIDKLLGSWLAIDSETYDENAETKKIWDKFRDIANIAMIIILIVVVFSQLTGYGIDNYGIKKLLPRLIAMAVLINLSYIICEILVDLSNILGVGLSNLFKSMTSYEYSAGEFATDVIGAIFAAVGIAGAAAPIAITIIDASIGGFGPMIIIVLVLTLLIALVAILEFFLMLGARLIIIYVFMAISPVAFACYILPNTQKYFKKWWDIFKAALVVYPICGALYGISFLIRGIVFRAEGIHLWQALVAICAPFVPFLILPSLLKKALAGLGAVGDSFLKLTGGLRKGLQNGRNAVKDSAMYKSEQIGRMRNIAKYRAGLDKNGNAIDESKIGRFRRFYSGGKTGMAQARAEYLRDLEAIDRENNIMGTGFASAMAGVKNKADAQRVADYQSLIQNGKETVSGSKVNINDADSVGDYHKHWLDRYSKATTDSERSEAMARMKAAQNILSKTDPGRAILKTNMMNAVNEANSKISSADDVERREAQARMQGLSDAASHLMNNYGDSYKTKDRGMHAMLKDLATMKTDDVAGATAGIAGKLSSSADGYLLQGTDKYTAETLADADESAIKGLVDNMSHMSSEQLKNIRATAYEALHNENIKVKPEVAKQLEKLAAGYTSSTESNSRAKILSHGAYRIRGSTTTPAVHLRELDNGKFVDDSGFEVDITHYEKQ